MAEVRNMAMPLATPRTERGRSSDSMSQGTGPQPMEKKNLNRTRLTMARGAKCELHGSSLTIALSVEFTGGHAEGQVM